MVNKESNMTSVPVALIAGLEPYLLLEFFDFPYLTVEKSLDDSLYINYYLSDQNDIFKRALVKISTERLKSFLSAELSLRDCFDNPENNLIYIASFNKAGKPVDLDLISAQDYQSISAIPVNYELDFDLSSQENESFDLSHKSQQIHKILIDVQLIASSLKGKLKYWSIKQFLVPFTELIRTSLIKLNANYTQQSLDKYIDIGFNRLSTGSLISTIELNYASDLFNNSREFDRISNLFSVLHANDEKELLVSLDKFEDKRIIFEYLKILKIIIKQDADLSTKLAAPDKAVFEVHLNKQKAQKIKKIIDEKIPEIEDIEEVQGVLVELSYRNSKPTFSIKGTLEDVKYIGKIDDQFSSLIQENQYRFIAKEYIFTVKTIYRPPTSTSPESVERTLLNINDVLEDE